MDNQTAAHFEIIDCVYYQPATEGQCAKCTHPENEIFGYSEDFLTGETTPYRAYSNTTPALCAACKLRASYGEL